MRLCVYSQINYTGQRACGIFAKGASSNFSGWWTIRSVRFLAYDASKPYDMSQELVTAKPPNVILYNSTLSNQRGEISGGNLWASNPNLTRSMPNSRVRTIQFTWRP
jgi:hypothetical protein